MAKPVERKCGNCTWFEGKRLGTCKDALERARAIVPFAVNLGGTFFVFSWGGKECPCFNPKPAKNNTKKD